MAKSGLTVRVRITGVRETLAAFRDLPADAAKELRASSMRIADGLAGRLRAAATADSAQSALMAPTVKPVRDRVPAVQAGGTKRVGRNRKPAFKVLFGSEFGSNTLRQFRPHTGQDGYWFFPTVRTEQDRIDREWNAAADEIIRRWGGR